MRTIKFEFTLSNREHQLLIWAGTSEPQPEQIKLLLLREAARLVRDDINITLQTALARRRTVDQSLSDSDQSPLDSDHLPSVIVQPKRKLSRPATHLQDKLARIAIVPPPDKSLSDSDDAA